MPDTRHHLAAESRITATGHRHFPAAGTRAFGPCERVGYLELSRPDRSSEQVAESQRVPGPTVSCASDNHSMISSSRSSTADKANL